MSSPDSLFRNYYNAYVAILVISILPKLLLLFIPSCFLKNENKNDIQLNYQQLMLNFGAAGLIGDVLIHILPHLLGEDHHHNHHIANKSTDTDVVLSHNHIDHDHHIEQEHVTDHHILLDHKMLISLTVVLGFIVFMIVEKLSLLYHNHDNDNDYNHDSICIPCNSITTESKSSTTNSSIKRSLIENSEGIIPLISSKGMSLRKRNVKKSIVNDKISTKSQANLSKKQLVEDSNDMITTLSSSRIVTTTGSKGSEIDQYQQEYQEQSQQQLGQSAQSKSLYQTLHGINVTGWLNLIADSMHNFTDGIAIGASFASSSNGFAATTTFISIAMHEIPHELGDFAILLQSGLTKLQAIQVQFLTAIPAIIGTTVGLVLTQHDEMKDFMLAFSAGGFLYLATVTMLVSKDHHNHQNHGSHSHRSITPSLLQIILELLCFLLGITMMVVVAILE